MTNISAEIVIVQLLKTYDIKSISYYELNKVRRHVESTNKSVHIDVSYDAIHNVCSKYTSFLEMTSINILVKQYTIDDLRLQCLQGIKSTILDSISYFFINS